MINRDMGNGFHVNSVRAWGEQKHYGGNIAGGFSTIYTVPADYEAVLSYFSYTLTGGVTAGGNLKIHNSDTSVKATLGYWVQALNAPIGNAHSLFPVFQMVAGEYVRIYSSNGAVVLSIEIIIQEYSLTA